MRELPVYIDDWLMLGFDAALSTDHTISEVPCALTLFSRNLCRGLQDHRHRSLINVNSGSFHGGFHLCRLRYPPPRWSRLSDTAKKCLRRAGAAGWYTLSERLPLHRREVTGRRMYSPTKSDRRRWLFLTL